MTLDTGRFEGFAARYPIAQDASAGRPLLAIQVAGFLLARTVQQLLAIRNFLARSLNDRVIFCNGSASKPYISGAPGRLAHPFRINFHGGFSFRVPEHPMQQAKANNSNPQPLNRQTPYLFNLSPNIRLRPSDLAVAERQRLYSFSQPLVSRESVEV